MSLGTVVDCGADVAVKASRKTLDVSSGIIAWAIRKTWRPIAKAMLGAYLGLAFMHYVAPAYLELETKLTSQVNTAFVKIAASYGLEARPLIEPRIDYVSIVERAALRHRFSESYGRQLGQYESKLNPKAKSAVGAIGLMQVMPENASLCGLRIEELWDPEKNADCGFKILRIEFDRFHDARKALMAYNGGPKAIPIIVKCGDNRTCMGKYAESYDEALNVINATATDMRG